MRTENHTDIERWIKPSQPQEQPESGYAEWLATEIEEGVAELDAGKGIPASEVWQSLGLE